MRIAILVAHVAIVSPLAACSIGDDTREGSRCVGASSNTFGTCEADTSPIGACMKLVACGAIPWELPNQYDFDYDRCVDTLEGTSAASQRLIGQCVAASKCDALIPSYPQGPDPRNIPCLHFGVP